MRRWLLTVALLAACEVRALDDVGPPGPAAGQPLCQRDDQCVPVASSCCGCPGFATADDPRSPDPCDGVECPPAPACPALEAACVDGACALRCAQIACDLRCDRFIVDDGGCLGCACEPGPAPPPPPPVVQCTVDGECAEVRADCCGCARGGGDTAVPATDVEAHDMSLGCPATDDPGCPDVDVCDPDARPRCLVGQCVLARDSSPPDERLPPGACGRPDLPPCAAGERCVLNLSAAATAAGVGICAR